MREDVLTTGNGRRSDPWAGVAPDSRLSRMVVQSGDDGLRPAGRDCCSFCSQLSCVLRRAAIGSLRRHQHKSNVSCSFDIEVVGICARWGSLRNLSVLACCSEDVLVRPFLAGLILFDKFRPKRHERIPQRSVREAYSALLMCVLEDGS